MSRESNEFQISPLPSWLDPASINSLRGSEVGAELDEYRKRADAVRAVLDSRRADVLITFKPASIDYLAGFSTMAPGKALLAVTGDDVRLYVAESEVGRAIGAPGATAVDLYPWDGPFDLKTWLNELQASRGIARFGLELGEKSTPALLLQMVQELELSSLDLTGEIERIRLIASDLELGRMRRAAEVTARGLQAGVEAAQASNSRDNNVAAAVMSAMMRTSDSIARGNVTIGVDEQGGIPHSPWTGRRIEAGSVVFMEFSGAYQRYCAPVMRTLVREPVSADVVELHQLASKLLNVTMEAMKPGAICEEIATAGHRLLGERSDILFHNNFGYPVGLSDHATWMNGAPFHITAANKRPLREGMVFHIPIVLRRFGQFAVGESQTVAVTATGIEILTERVRPSGLIRI